MSHTQVFREVERFLQMDDNKHKILFIYTQGFTHFANITQSIQFKINLECIFDHSNKELQKFYHPQNCQSIASPGLHFERKSKYSCASFRELLNDNQCFHRYHVSVALQSPVSIERKILRL
eukprot:gb/GECH01009082.1/.p1 GENE.gb/GECH01009082.1/~~gb/GECH01009082.1/.p1  ORF type:complete len:121 (+),score=16.64 gb/GECH01009082.1/:1-363(+)